MKDNKAILMHLELHKKIGEYLESQKVNLFEILGVISQLQNDFSYMIREGQDK